MKDEREQHKAELADLAATHQQKMEQIKHEVDRLQTMNLEKDARLLQLEQQRSSEMEVCIGLTGSGMYTFIRSLIATNKIGAKGAYTAIHVLMYTCVHT